MDVAANGWDARRFARARRHSRLVRGLRWMLPMAALGAFALFVGASWVASLLPNVTIGPVQLQGGALVMSNPRLTGFDGERRPYELQADRARQDVRNPRRVELDKLTARMNLAANGWVRLSADQAFYDADAETFRAAGNVHVSSTLGYDVFLEEAMVDFKARTLRSHRPVEGRQGENRIFAERLSAFEGGSVVVFEGGVRVIYHQDAPTAP